MGTKGIIIFKRIFRASDDFKIKVKKISLFKYKFKWIYWIFKNKIIFFQLFNHKNILILNTFTESN